MGKLISQTHYIHLTKFHPDQTSFQISSSSLSQKSNVLLERESKSSNSPLFLPQGVNVRITGPAGISQGTSIVSRWLTGMSTVCVILMF